MGNENAITLLKQILLQSESNHLKLNAIEALTQITDSRKILDEAEISIQDLFKQLQNTDRNNLNEISKEITGNHTLKKRLLLAFKAGGQEALNQILNSNALTQIPIEMIKGFLEDK